MSATEPMVDNGTIASRLEETAELLQAQRANPFRVAAYRNAAATVRNLGRSVAEIYSTSGDDGLRALPGIGDRLGSGLRSLILTGRLPILDRLRGEMDPVALLESVPGIGPKLAEHLHHDLGIDTLEELEIAAHSGRLSHPGGIGVKKLAGITDLLATRLGRARTRPPLFHEPPPPIAEILDVDREYREKAARGDLPLIAPRRFNPNHEAWLPILHTQRGERHYTALYSNTARAHKMNRIRDWVLLYYDHGAEEQQCTVITAQRGLCADERVVAGRDRECADYYRTRNRELEESHESSLSR
jgi:DNA polymerase (family 10)